MTHKLLLADDSVTIQRVIELTFADEDVQVIVVSDGRQAIERVQSERPDIVLADIGMPERDGYEVAAFIKGHPQLAQIPVLLLTGAFEPLDENRARSVGCDGVLVKPFDPQMVINRVKELLAGRRPPASRGAPAAQDVPPGAAAPQPSAHGERVLASPAARSQSEPPEKTAGDSLEDYFDRLDAAFSNIGAPPSNRAQRLEREDVSAGVGELDQPSPDAPAAPDPLTSWDPELAGELAPARQPHLANAFAALLAVEEGHAAPPAAFAAAAPAPAMLPEEMIEEVVQRVIARMADDSMRRLVAETAERLVREEIDRIKSMSHDKPG